jgi:phage N-6-adenine-methyltransferase
MSSITHSSATNEWATPWDLYEQLHAEFDFQLDVAAATWNAKCDRYLTKADNSLNLDWSARCDEDRSIWCNPPYGKETGKFVERAYRTAFSSGPSQPRRVVCLVFSRTDTKWWVRYAMRASEIRFITGRVHFTREDGQTGPATAASCVIIFDPANRRTFCPQVSCMRMRKRAQRGMELDL